MRHGVHAKGHFLLWVLVKLFPHGKCLSNHLALFDPLGLIVASTNNSYGGAQKGVGKKKVSANLKIQQKIDRNHTLYLLMTYLHQVLFQIRMVALVQTQVLIAIPVPNMENRLIFSTMRLGRFLIMHCGIGLLV